MFHIAFYVPENHSEAVKEKMFQAGAGALGKYENCSFETKGVGQFKPLVGANPYLGIVGKLEIVVELKVEMICESDHIEKVIMAMKSAHPYETPAYYVTKTVKI